METTDRDQKYNLKWNSHDAIMASTVLEHLAGEELVDVTLSCEGKFIKVHKLILSASSQYFKELFKIHQGNNPIIIMMNIKFEYLQHIIDYIYKGEVKLLSSDIESLLKLANYLQIKGLYGILNKKFQSLSDEGNPNSKQETKNLNDSGHIRDQECNSSQDKLPVSKNPISKNIIILGQEPFPSGQKKEQPERKRAKGAAKINNDVSKRRKVVSTLEKEKRINTLVRKILPKPNPEETRAPEPPNVCSQFNFFQEPEIIIKEDLDPLTTNPEPNNEFSSSSVNGNTNNFKVKRISAFMLFTEEYRSKVSAAYPEEDFKRISLRLSTMWKNLPCEKKDSYYEAASRESEKQKQKVQH